jgi:hypothetical protein
VIIFLITDWCSRSRNLNEQYALRGTEEYGSGEAGQSVPPGRRRIVSAVDGSRRRQTVGWHTESNDSDGFPWPPSQIGGRCLRSSPERNSRSRSMSPVSSARGNSDAGACTRAVAASPLLMRKAKATSSCGGVSARRRALDGLSAGV